MPFTRDQFFMVFERYNAALWPASIAAYVLAAAALVAIIAGWQFRARLAATVLSLMWGWTAIAYHLVFFAPVNALANLFAFLFVLQSALFIHFGVLRGRWQIDSWTGWRSTAGWALIAYAGLAYPVVGVMTGHSYGGIPQFGVTPCPVTLFTFGLLLLSRPPLPWILLAMPVVWSLIGGSAAFLLGVPQDWPLLVSGILATALLWTAAPPSAPRPS